ncbi:MAG: OmpA-OmpF porin, family [Clostridiales bacterium]|jgi:outer membrane protein OmpA-like peptidoglycan-associated protein|nr:OmpA-OmpF porin, family [Clostridiales bacterium]MDN5283271.1 OmpA-OmpF porin, family [Candidatus Ozemobacter sp.]
MDRLRLLVLSFVLVMVAFSGSAKTDKEHPLVRPFPGSVLAENMSNYSKFNSCDFYCLNDKTRKREKKNVKGEYWRLLYEVRTASGDRVKTISKLEFFENYKAAAKEKGGKVVYEDSGQIVITIPRDDNGTTWLRVAGNAGLGQQDLIIVDEQPFKKTMTFGPAEMKAALDSEGRVQLHDILFDLDKATLKQESTRQLQHVVTLLKNSPDLSLEIQGHTDNQGADEYNLRLSQRRAETVVAYLALFDIPPDRLVAKGYGETKPVASNATDEGRAQNRRVELVKR